MDLQPEHKITYGKDGAVSIDGVKLTTEQAALLFLDLLKSGRAEQFLASAPKSFTAVCARLSTFHELGDWEGQKQAFATLCDLFMSQAGMTADATPREGQVPTTQNLPPALRAGAVLCRDFPLEAHNGRRDPKEWGERAQAIESMNWLLGLFSACGDRARRNVGVVAQEAVTWVGQLIQAIAPAEPKNARLTEAAAPLHSYVQDPVLRAMSTKRTVARARDVITAEVTEQLFDKARGEARAELRGKLDDRFADLLRE